MRPLSPAARDHFERPRQVGALDADAATATALVGEPASGAVLQLQLRVDERDRIADARFKAHGCGWTIACGSLLTAWLQGRDLAEAARFRHSLLVDALEVPPEKLHCAVLAETALKAALRDHAAKQNRPAAIQAHHLSSFGEKPS